MELKLIKEEEKERGTHIDGLQQQKIVVKYSKKAFKPPNQGSHERFHNQ